jgi:hypothetical protein
MPDSVFSVSTFVYYESWFLDRVGYKKFVLDVEFVHALLMLTIPIFTLQVTGLMKTVLMTLTTVCIEKSTEFFARKCSYCRKFPASNSIALHAVL